MFYPVRYLLDKELPRWGLTLFNFLLVAVIAYVLTAYPIHTQRFFNRDLPQVDHVNNTWVGYQASESITEVRFTYSPNARAPSLYVLSNYMGFESDYEALRLSGLTSHPSGLYLFRNGKFQFLPLNKTMQEKASRIVINFTDDSLQVSIDGTVALSTKGVRPTTTVDFAFYPSYLLHKWRPPQTTIDHLAVYTQNTQAEMPSRIMRTATICLVVLGAILALMGIDRFTYAMLLLAFHNRRISRNVRSLYLSVPAFLLVVFVFFSLIMLKKEPLPLTNDFMNGRYVRHGEQSSGTPAMKIFTFGGSTTRGVPYQRQWSWPERLHDCLNRERLGGSRTAEVYDFSEAGSRIYDQLPLSEEAFFANEQPQVVIIDTLINDFHYMKPFNVLSQLVGFRVGVDAVHHRKLNHWLIYYSQVIDMLQSHGVSVIVTIPSFDIHFFGKEPMREWQDALRALAIEKNVRIAETGQTLSETEHPFLYSEFIHPTRIGYGLIAESVCRMLSSSNTASSVSGF